MKKKVYIGLAAIYIFFMTAIGYNASLALFVDSATSTNNTFTAAVEFATPSATMTPTGTPTPTGPEASPIATTGAIVINEVSSDGAASTEWVELYNPTSTSINVSGWRIGDQNTFDTPADDDDTFPSVTPIPPGGFAVVITTGSSVVVPGSALTITLPNGTIGSGLNDPGDSVILRNSANTIIDTTNYGTESSFFTSQSAAPGSGQTISRNPNGVDTNTGADWILDTTPSIGVTN